MRVFVFLVAMLAMGFAYAGGKRAGQRKGHRLEESTTEEYEDIQMDSYVLIEEQVAYAFVVKPKQWNEDELVGRNLYLFIRFQNSNACSVYGEIKVVNPISKLTIPIVILLPQEMQKPYFYVVPLGNYEGGLNIIKEISFATKFYYYD